MVLVQITGKDDLMEYPQVTHQHGLVTAILGVRMPLMTRHFREGTLRAKCVAKVSPVLWSADRESLLERVSTLFENREALLLGSCTIFNHVNLLFEMKLKVERIKIKGIYIYFLI